MLFRLPAPSLVRPRSSPSLPPIPSSLVSSTDYLNSAISTPVDTARLRDAVLPGWSNGDCRAWSGKEGSEVGWGYRTTGARPATHSAQLSPSECFALFRR